MPKKITISQKQLIQIKNELKMAEKLNEQELKPIIRESLRRYTGTWIPNIGADWDVILNEIYPIVQFNLPSIFFRNPRVFLKPRNKTFIKRERNPFTGEMEMVQADSQKSANTQEHVLNYDLGEIKFKKQVQKVLLDALLFPHGVLWHGYKGNFGMTEENSFYIKDEKIFVKRVSPLRFLKDPCVTMSDLHEGKWVARAIDIPLQDLIEDDKLDVDKNLKGFRGFGDKIGTLNQQQYLDGGGDTLSLPGRQSLIDFTDNEYKKSNSCQFVRVHEVFLRPTKKEARQGHKGYILLLTEEQKKPLRVNSWDIKAEGFPAKILEFNAVPDQVFGMSDIDSYKYIADQKNAIVNLQLRNAQENSKVWVGISKDEMQEEDIERVQEGDQTILMFNDSDKPIRDRMTVASPGGQASSELYLIDQRIQRNIEDKSGVSDLKKGFLQSGEESATSVRLRAAGSSARPRYRQDIMSDFLTESCHYLLQLEKQFLTVKDAVRIVGNLDVEWSDKPSKADIQADVDVEIDVISMLPENPEQELKELNQVLMLMIEGLQNPVVREKLLQEGKTMNLSPIIEQILTRLKIRNPDVFRNIKPEESEGYVSVREVREAKENVNAALQGAEIPFPPTPEDDHRAKLEVYSTVAGLLEQAGQVSEALMQVMQMQQALMIQQEEKQAEPGKPVNLNKPQVETIGA